MERDDLDELGPIDYLVVESLARDSPEPCLCAPSRRPTTQPSAAPLTGAVVWVHEVPQGVANPPRIDGKDGVAGSIPAGGSTTNQPSRPTATPSATDAGCGSTTA
jgi:hypothetical protein